MGNKKVLPGTGTRTFLATRWVSLLRIGSLLTIIWVKNTRVVDPDPDPYWIRIQLGLWIRIRIRNPDPDPGGQK